MAVKTVAVIAQGEMGAGTGGQLVHHGLRVITNLTGRSGRSIGLAKDAGMEDVGNDAALINEADMFLSILPPVQAVALAKQMAPHIKAANKSILYADCNAVAPPPKKKFRRSLSLQVRTLLMSEFLVIRLIPLRTSRDIMRPGSMPMISPS